MRIIGGKYRSRVLAEFEGMDVRPTGDRVREALFNILSLKIYGARALDLFCGSGALGLECLSRGASEATFNDFSRESVKILEKNLRTLGIGKDEAKVYSVGLLALSKRIERGIRPYLSRPALSFRLWRSRADKDCGKGIAFRKGDRGL